MFFLFPAAVILLIAVFLIPLRKRAPSLRRRGSRFDERDISFARHNLKEGTPEYRDYYSRKPDIEDPDRMTRALPGLLSPVSKYYEPLNSAAADASFFIVENLRDAAEGEPGERREDLSDSLVLKYLMKWIEHSGADCVAAGQISTACWYSHVGRGTGAYGEEITPEHKSAIVIGYRMGPELTFSAPESSEVVEAALRYSYCAVTAVQAAQFLRNLGYHARAHIDGNYRVIAAEAARQAGLGSFGWSGLLLHRKYGPAVRYSVVTTDLSVPAWSGKEEPILDFCRVCKKCVRNCPSRSINKVEPGSVDADRCFAYWNAVGTDCGVCMAVCPMGHPWGILKKLAVKSLFAARLLVLLDNIIYGGKHESKEGTEKWKE